MLRPPPATRNASAGSSVTWLVRTLILFYSAQLSAQTDSTFSNRTLPETVVKATQFSTNGYAVWTADTLPVSAVGTLSERLFLENALIVRQNAPGTLATLSARGAGAARTAVFWNGLNLQSPMNGVADASLVPFWPGDKLEIVQGGYSAALSTGAMGGAVLINSLAQTAQHKGFFGGLGLQGGSFGAFAGRGSLGFQSGRLQGEWRGNWQQAKNDFPFQKTGLDGKPYQTRQENNTLHKADFQQTIQWQANTRHLIKSALWRQLAFRQIPPAITEATSDTWQADQATRALVSWMYTPGSSAQLATQAAWLDEFIEFYFAGASEKSWSRTAILSSDWNQKLGQHWNWGIGGSGQIVYARSDGYRLKNHWFSQQRYALRGNAAYRFNKTGMVSILVRQEWAENQGAPFTWTLGFLQPIGNQLKIRGHLARNFNLPTFNDRFWKGLGQADLLPEKGFSTDVGIRFEQKQLDVDVNGFYLVLDDWILWQPGPDGLFRPGNLRKVNSRGVEAKADYRFNLRKWQFKLKGQLQWSATENVAVYGGAEAALGKQLPYTPSLSGSAGFWASRRQISMAWLHQFTGQQYITSDHQFILSSFQTSALMAQWTGKCWHGHVTFNLKLDNVWDVPYATLANRPMPGRNGSIGISFQW